MNRLSIGKPSTRCSGDCLANGAAKGNKREEKISGDRIRFFFGRRAHAVVRTYRERSNPSDRPHLLRRLRKEISIQGHTAGHALCCAGLDLQHVQLPWQGVLRFEADPRGHSESFPFTKTYGNLNKLGSTYARNVVCAASSISCRLASPSCPCPALPCLWPASRQ